MFGGRAVVARPAAAGRRRIGDVRRPAADGDSPQRQPSSLARLAGRFDVELGPKSDLAAAFAALAARLVRRGVVVVLSDLFDDPERLAAGLRQFRFRHHDVILLQVLDSAELTFPFDDGKRFLGMEGEPAAAVDTRAIRGAYLAEFEKFLAAVKSSARAQGIDYLLARTDRPFDETLAAYLAARLARVKP